MSCEYFIEAEDPIDANLKVIYECSDSPTEFIENHILIEEVLKVEEGELYERSGG